MPRSAPNMCGGPTGGYCSVELLAPLAVRIALEAAVFVASGETGCGKSLAPFTKAVSPSAPAERRRAIRSVVLLRVAGVCTGCVRSA
jgi:hypothetical protein